MSHPTFDFFRGVDIQCMIAPPGIPGGGRHLWAATIPLPPLSATRGKTFDCGLQFSFSNPGSFAPMLIMFERQLDLVGLAFAKDTQGLEFESA